MTSLSTDDPTTTPLTEIQSSLSQQCSAKSLLYFLSNATKRLSSPDFVAFLGTHLNQHTFEDRGAIFEQVIAFEYCKLFKDNTTNPTEQTEDNITTTTEELRSPLFNAKEWSEESKRANAEAGIDLEERNDPTLHKVLALLDYYVNEKPHAQADQILRGWQQLELMEERAALRSSLPDEEFAALLTRDKECDKYGEECYNELNQTLPTLPPQKRLEKAQTIQKAGMAALLKASPNFKDLEPGEKQKVIQDMSSTDRKPVIRMNVLNVVMQQMQRMQMLGQQMIQQFMQLIPKMQPSQQEAQMNMLREKAFEVLPNNFIEMSVEDRQVAAMSVPYEKKLPVIRWNAMCAALQTLMHRQQSGGGGGHGHSHGGKPCGGHGNGHGGQPNKDE